MLYNTYYLIRKRSHQYRILILGHFPMCFDEPHIHLIFPCLLQKNIGVIDIRFYTSDILTIDNLEPVEKQIASLEN